MKLASIASDELILEWGKSRLAAKAGHYFMQFLGVVGEEVKELLLACLVKSTGPLAKVGIKATQALADPKDEIILDLGYAIVDAAKLPIAFVGLGYVAFILPLFGVGAGGIMVTKLFGWLSYTLYRIACKHPKYREKLKHLLPHGFLPKELQQEIDAGRQDKLSQTANQRRVREANQRLERQRYRPGLEELPRLEHRQR